MAVAVVVVVVVVVVGAASGEEGKLLYGDLLMLTEVLVASCPSNISVQLRD